MVQGPTSPSKSFGNQPRYFQQNRIMRRIDVGARPSFLRLLIRSRPHHLGDLLTRLNRVLNYRSASIVLFGVLLVLLLLNFRSYGIAWTSLCAYPMDDI